VPDGRPLTKNFLCVLLVRGRHLVVAPGLPSQLLLQAWSSHYDFDLCNLARFLLYSSVWCRRVLSWYDFFTMRAASQAMRGAVWRDPPRGEVCWAVELSVGARASLSALLLRPVQDPFSYLVVPRSGMSILLKIEAARLHQEVESQVSYAAFICFLFLTQQLSPLLRIS